jgi:hypothetical protein
MGKPTLQDGYVPGKGFIELKEPVKGMASLGF